MDLEHYLYKYKIDRREYANRIKISYSALSNILQGRVSPSLTVAINIVNESHGEITFVELVKRADRKKIKKFRKKHSQKPFIGYNG